MFERRRVKPLSDSTKIKLWENKEVSELLKLPGVIKEGEGNYRFSDPDLLHILAGKSKGNWIAFTVVPFDEYRYVDLDTVDGAWRFILSIRSNEKEANSENQPRVDISKISSMKEAVINFTKAKNTLTRSKAYKIELIQDNKDFYTYRFSKR